MNFMDAMSQLGYAGTGGLNDQEVLEILAFLRSRPVHPGCHVRYAAGPACSWDEAQSAHVLCWHHESVLLAPHLLEFALSRAKCATDWLGTEDAVLYSVNVFCTRPGGPVRPDIQDWHKDRDDDKFVPMFVALTDGVHQELRLPGGQVSAIDAVSGDAFFSNTMLDHRGAVPEAERIIFWARWGISERPAAYQWDQLYPIDRSVLGDRYPTDPALQRMLRLLAC